MNRGNKKKKIKTIIASLDAFGLSIEFTSPLDLAFNLGDTILNYAIYIISIIYGCFDIPEVAYNS